jgi:hypothetical protein
LISLVFSRWSCEIPRGRLVMLHALVVYPLPRLISFGGGRRNRGGVQAGSACEISSREDGGI